jgi:hypothetical protein
MESVNIPASVPMVGLARYVKIQRVMTVANSQGAIS